MGRYKYRVFVNLDSPDSGLASALRPGATCRVTVRADHHQSHRGKFFSALVSTPSGTSSQAPDHGVELTVSVLGDDVPDYLEAGDAVELWCGQEIGHGTVTRRLFLWAET